MSATAEAPKQKAIPGTPPDYTKQPAEYLTYHGWKPLGVPDWPGTRWLDPEKPYPDETYEMVPCFAPDPEGNMQRVMARDPRTGTPRAVSQVLKKCPAVPLSRLEALEIQISRDIRAEADKLREQLKAEKKKRPPAQDV